MPTFIAREPIEHDGVRTEPGGELKLTEAAAAPLLALGHVEAKPAAGKAKSEADAPAPAPAVQTPAPAPAPAEPDKA